MSLSSPQPLETDAIVAACTASGRAGIAVVRLSGSNAYAVADRFCEGAPVRPSELPAGTFRLFKLHDPADGRFIDEAIVLAFRAPHSYTGEDTVEFQSHGGRMPVSHILAVLIACGARAAEPGEFSRRAFLNGRMDLSMAEAVMDVIGAQSERAGHLAAEQLEGRLGRRLDACYDALMAVCADVEASLDFGDDESNDVLEPADIPGRLGRVRDDLRALADTWREGVLLREGARVVISGVPNAGKSTLFNALLGILRAIVTDVPGTTRDTIEETLLLDGIPLRVVDTAGLRETDSSIEQMGIDRALRLIQSADLNLRLIDLTADLEPQIERLTRVDVAGKTLVVLSKADRLAGDRIEAVRRKIQSAGHTCVVISALEWVGMDALRMAMKRKLLGEGASLDEPEVAVSERHHGLIETALKEIETALELYADGGDGAAVFCAQALRAAAESLAQITGRVYSEDLLDSVFSRFCIGK